MDDEVRHHLREIERSALKIEQYAATAQLALVDTRQYSDVGSVKELLNSIDQHCGNVDAFCDKLLDAANVIKGLAWAIAVAVIVSAAHHW